MTSMVPATHRGASDVMTVIVALTSLLAAVGCSGPNQTSGLMVGVFPIDAIGISPDEAARARGTISARLSGGDTVSLVPDDRVDRQLSRSCGTPAADQRVRCATGVGRRVGATHMLLGSLGGLGSTYVLQLQLLSVKRAAVTRSLEETVFGKEQSRRNTVADLAQRLLRTEARPWYRQWWVWVAAGVAVAAIAAAVAVPLALSGDDDPYRDINVP